MIDPTSRGLLAPGQRLGGYVIEHAIGHGAFGAVYRARSQSRPTAPVALKVIGNHGNLDRLLLEPGILSQLSHPNIVRLVDYFVEDGVLVLVMEYIEGDTLEGYLRKRGRLRAAEVRDMLVQLARALDHAHGRGVIHRDIKLGNVLVDQRGAAPRFILADFGVARIAQGIQLHRRVGGTYHFMAPEQLRGRAVAQSDLWSLGVTAYAALSGHLPFSGATLDDLSRGVFYDTPTAPSHLAGEISTDLDEVVLRLLEKQLENRTASAAQLLVHIGAEAAEIHAPRPVVPSRRTTWEKSIETTMRWSLMLCVLSAAVGFFPFGPIGSMIGLAAGILVFKSYQERRSRWVFASALALGACGAGLSWIERSLLLPCIFEGAGGAYTSARFLWSWEWCFMWVPVRFLLKARRLQLELALVRNARDSTGDTSRLLQSLWALLEDNPNDVTVHLRIVEALLASGNTRQAIVEARLILYNDWYNAGAALLLAHAYFDIGLHGLCAQLCDRFLAVTGYAFEMAELKQSAARMLSR